MMDRYAPVTRESASQGADVRAGRTRFQQLSGLCQIGVLQNQQSKSAEYDQGARIEPHPQVDRGLVE